MKENKVTLIIISLVVNSTKALSDFCLKKETEDTKECTVQAVAAITQGNINKIKENQNIMLFFEKLRQDGKSLLMIAIQKDQMDIVKFLLSSRPDKIDISSHIDSCDQLVQPEQIEEFLEKRIRKDESSSHGGSVFQKLGDLLDTPDLKYRTKMIMEYAKYTSLYVAILNNSTKYVDLLLQHGARMDFIFADYLESRHTDDIFKFPLTQKVLN